MSNILLAGFSITVALILIIASHFYKKRQSDGNEPFLFAAASILLLLTGIVILSSPLTQQTGNEETINYTYATNATGQQDNILSTTSTINYTYQLINSTINTAIGTILVLVGMFASVSAITRISFKKDREERIEFD